MPLHPSHHEDYANDGRTYGECLDEMFCPDYVADLIRAAHGLQPPYRLLDSGSASGLTLDLFAQVGIEAWGIENSPYIHAETPAHRRNLLGDVCKLPFPDNYFDAVYDTCLVYVPEGQIDMAIGELFRVCKVGVFLLAVTPDMTPEVIEQYDLLDGVATAHTLPEWSRYFLRNGFEFAINDAETLRRVWQIEKGHNEGGPLWYRTPADVRCCFYRKPRQV